MRLFIPSAPVRSYGRDVSDEIDAPTISCPVIGPSCGSDCIQPITGLERQIFRPNVILENDGDYVDPFDAKYL